MATHLPKLVYKPDASPKIYMMVLMATMSFISGLMNMTTSSAYSDTLERTTEHRRGAKMDCDSAHRMSPPSTSIARTNNIGDKGSPCRKPLAWQMRLPSLPLRRTLVLADPRRIDIYFLHRLLKPSHCRTSKRKGQQTESKAFAISILRRRQLCFFWCKVLQVR